MRQTRRRWLALLIVVLLQLVHSYARMQSMRSQQQRVQGKRPLAHTVTFQHEAGTRLLAGSCVLSGPCVLGML
jgi:hypothetical protein